MALRSTAAVSPLTCTDSRPLGFVVGGHDAARPRALDWRPRTPIPRCLIRGKRKAGGGAWRTLKSQGGGEGGPRDMRYVGRAAAIHTYVPVGRGVGFGLVVQQHRERLRRRTGHEASENGSAARTASPSATGNNSAERRRASRITTRRLYVIDTNVILHDSSCLWRFGRHDICLPITVLEELDKFKRGNEEINFHAREFLRMLDEMTVERAARRNGTHRDNADQTMCPDDAEAAMLPQHPERNSTASADRWQDHFIRDGVLLGEDEERRGRMRISLHCRDDDVERLFFYDCPDTRILSCVQALAAGKPEPQCDWTAESCTDADGHHGDAAFAETSVAPRYERVVLVTKDVNLRMKARAMGLFAEDYEQDRVESVSKLYTGQRLVENVPDAIIEQLHRPPFGVTLEEVERELRNWYDAQGLSTTVTAGEAPWSRRLQQGESRGGANAPAEHGPWAWMAHHLLPREHRPATPNAASGVPAANAPDGDGTAASTSSSSLQPLANEHFVFRNPARSVLASYSFSKAAGRFLFQRVATFGAYGIMPRNAEQRFALQALVDPDIPLVSIAGVAGTGKTLICLAAALEMQSRGACDQIYVSRPVVPLGNRDVGFLPGDLEEKLAPYMQPLYDNLSVIKAADCHVRDNGKVVPGPRSRAIDELLASARLKVAALAYVRGRSLTRTFFIIDESQNLTPHEVKAIITRAGDGTKIVLCGDLHQIDNPYVDGCSNGLSYLIERMKGQRLYAHVTLERGERSELSKLASELL
ncbi:hypothetical protein CDCA_CDCA03G0887 [Cyanidium caldarium]|uniref:PhoH family protein n=1 Tax=Cyanidium caldarium TaxID=2771 RepID=A0AAV9IRJ4_CYACA|nr:hypothetical protein CDCA_CDCA03G0887 [Cyanidium caldarium]